MEFPFMPPHAFLQLQAAKDAAEVFLKQNRFLDALSGYNVAIEIAANLRLPQEELAKIFSNRSLVYIKLGSPLEALRDAEQCIGLYPDWWKGYWRAATAHKMAGSLRESTLCLAALWSRHGRSLNKDDQIQVLAEMAITVPMLYTSQTEMEYPECIHAIASLDIPTDLALWSKVVQQLASTNNWEAVQILILGGSFSGDCPFEGVAAECSTEGIVVRNLLCALNESDLKSWGINLAVCLLKKGADVNTICRSPEEPIPISALITALQTGVHDLFKYVMENIPAARLQIDYPDQFGETALHIIVKSDKINSFSGEGLLKLLLNYGCMTNICDRHGKLPIDYLDKRSPAYGILLNSSQKKDGNIQQKIAMLREAGNRAQKENNNKQALRHYEAAISLAMKENSLKTELAILHSNCSLVYSNMCENKNALASAHNAVMADSKYYKGYWRLGQVYKSEGKFSEAFDVFISGLIQAVHSDEDSKTRFLLEIARLLPPLENSGSILLNKLTEVSRHYSASWLRIAETLSKYGNWLSVKILVMGVNYKPVPLPKAGMVVKDINFWPNPQGIAAKFPASSVILDSIADAPEAIAWADELLMVLLSQNASLETLTTSTNTPSFHIVIKMCMLAGNAALMCQVLNIDQQLARQRQLQNDKGKTLFHIICHLSDRGESAIGVKLTQILLDHRFDANVCDNSGLRPQDLVPPFSSLGKLLSSGKHVKSSEPTNSEDLGILSNAKLFKEEGNKEFKRQNYPAAVYHYSKAIEVYTERIDSLTQENHHDLSVLYGNRAECFLKLGQPNEALEDAKESVGYDPNWHKAHTRVGRSFQALKKEKKALKAFINAYNLLPATADNVIQIEILSEIIILFHQVEGKGKSGQQIPGLNPVKCPVWVLTAYNFIRQNHIWEHAYMAFQQIKSKTDRLSLDLKPFCKKKEMRNNVWSLDFILMLLQSGSDHRTLSFDIGDTYLHAGALTYFLTGMDHVFKWLVDNKAVPLNELNIQDKNGNTVLHLAVMTDCNMNYKDNVVDLLLKYRANPLITNSLQQKALECLRSGDQKLKMRLEYAEKAFCKGQPSKPLPKKNKENLVGCQLCEKLVADATDLFIEGKYTKGIKNLVEVINKPHRETKHQQLSARSADIIVDELGKMLTPDIPDCMTSLSVEHYKSILEKLAKKDKWRQIDAAVQKYETKHGDKKLSRFAKNISLVQLVKSSSLRGSESLRLQILDLIYSHGGVLPVDDVSMHAAVSQLEFRVVEWLIDHGVSPSFFSLTPGDTPIHAALTVALEKDRGNFVLFDKFLALYNEDSEKYKFLDPSRQDRDGNSLLHIACRCRFNKHSLKAVETLCERQVPADVTNNDGKMPIQYLTDRNDRRAQFLRIAVPHNTEPKMKTSSAGNLKEKEHSSHKTTSEKKQIDTSDNRDTGIRVSAVKTDSVQECKEQIMELINDLSDCSFSVFKSDGSKQQGSKKVQYMSQTSADEVEAAHSESTEETIAAEKSDNEETNEEDVDTEMDLEEDEEGSAEEKIIDPKVFDNLEWEVECTSDVWKTLKDKHVPSEMKQRVIQRIKLLASGEWRPYLCYKVPNAPATLKLRQAKLSKAARIIWELAIAFSPRLSEAAERRLEAEGKSSDDFAVKGGRIYSEIIRVWDIVLDHSHLNHVIEKIIKSHHRGEGCILQRKLKGIKEDQFRGSNTKKRIPMLFAEAEDDIDLTSLKKQQQSLKLYPPASPQETEYHILKFYSFSSALVSDILHNHEIKVDFPFRVTDTEHAIINLESKSPLLLLGRSGTGKTTCCLYRLWTVFTMYWTKAKEAGGPLLPREQQFIKQTAEETEVAEDDVDTNTSELCDDATLSHADSGIMSEESSSMANDEYDEEEEDEYTGPFYDHLHQLFVTKNSVLCTEVHKNFSELCHASDVAEEHIKMENEILPNRLQDVNDFLYPLFLTSKQLLLILDASVGPPYFFERNDDGSLKVVIQGWGTQDDLFGFTPLDHESDDEQPDEEDIDMQYEAVVEEMHGKKKQKMDPRREVTYEVFAAEVWPKIKKKMSVSYHPTLVWTEIMSFIRGSFEALTKPNGILKKDEYIDLGRKRAPNFSGERDKIYQLFLRYDHFKTQKFLFDESDLIYSIHKRLQNLKEQPWILHQIYVDETQDFTQAELAVLIHIIQNPNNMFLTGDTAQSIMRGISFRFSDLKSLFYYAEKSLQAVGKTSSIKVPKQVYQLTHNYRSHAGILSLASAILDLMVEFFPDSFDRLQKDQGLFHGPRPVLLESCSPSDLAILLQGHKRKTSHIEFGAHQAILVVNEEARESIPEELRLGLILTIYEAKGLEFDDVLLYNFFKDSYASKEWRVVTDYVERMRENLEDKNNQENLVVLDEEVLKQSSRPRPLTFDPNQHKVLNSELKHLYTALTRARVNVWIFDQSEEKRAPMFEYFKVRRLVQLVSTGSLDSDSNMFAEKSSPAEWEKRGDEIMKRSLYDVAAKCYKMAGCENKEKIALAHNQALKASRMKDSPRRMREEYMSAAKTFLECGLVNKAALCLQNAHEYELAAQTFEKCGQLLPAARMYYKAKTILDCSRCYEQLGYFNKATDVLYKEELFDQVIDCLRRHKMILQDCQSKGKTVPRVIQENPPQDAYTEERLTYKSAEMHHRYGNKAKMIAALGRLTRVNEKINFLIQHNYHDEAAEYLIDEGKTTEAAQLLLKSGKLQEALTAAEKGRDLALIGECHYILSQVLRDKTDKKQESEIHLTRATESFQAADDRSGLGKTRVILAKKRKDKALAKQAYRTFSEEKPFANEAGMLEALQVYLELSDFELQYEDTSTVLRGIEMTFSVIEKLFQQTSSGDHERAQMYYRFFGLYQNAANTSVFEIHPKEGPHCIQLIEDFFVDCKEKKEKIIQREKSQICVSLSRLLIGRMKAWLNAVESSLQQQIQQHVQCKMYLQGSECEDKAICPYMHEVYNQSSALKALNIFAQDVSLSFIVQSGVDMIRKLGINDLSEEVDCLVEEETKFDSCKRLLEFLMPEHQHPKFLSAVVREIHRQWHNSNMSRQVCKYLENLWLQPTKKSKKDMWKERCRSTCWVLEIVFFSSLMKLNLDATQYCQKLEKQLMADAPNWLAKRSHSGGIPYALFVDYNKGTLLVECLANRFIEAIYWLKRADPMESIIKFTKFIRILSMRDRPALLPTKAMMLFWMEVFVTLSFFLLAKISVPGTHFILPETYLAAIAYIDLTFEKHQTLQSIVHQYRPKKDMVNLLWDRIQIIIGLVCGYRSHMSLLRLLFTCCKDDFCAAERCLILTLVFLVNVGALLPDIFEDHIMKSILRIQLPDHAPERLHRTLSAISIAKGFSDIATILKKILLQRENDHLLDCVWNWNNAKQQGVQTCPVTDLSRLPKKFLIFNPTENVDDVIGSCSLLEEEGHLSEEEEITAEECERFQREHQQLEIQDKKKKAAKIIQRFFRHITMKYRIENLGKRALKQEMIDMFAPYSIQDTFCGVCGVPLKSEIDPQNSSLEDITNTEGSVETHLKHIQSNEHIEKNMKFDSFKQLYYVHNMRKLLHELSFFIGFHKLRNEEMKAKCYADVSLDIDRLLSEMDNVNTILQNIMEKRSWEKIEEFRHALFILYQDYIFGRGVIAHKFREYKESVNEKSKDSPVPEQHEPSPDIDVIDNDDLHEDVVSDPRDKYQQRGHGGHQYKRGQGRGGGRGRGRGPSHGYSRQRNLPPNLPPRILRQLNII